MAKVQKKKQSPKQAAVTITPRMQQAFLGAVAATWLLQVGISVYYLTKSARYTNLDFWWMQAAYSALPLIFFGLSLWYVGAFGSRLSQLFKAALLTVTAYLLFMFVQQLLVMSGWRWFNGYYGQEQPGVIALYGPQIMLYCTAVATYAGALLYVKKRRARRG